MANPFLVLGGVAVGVITAGIGVLQVPGWIDSANDSAVRNDLGQIALAQEAAYTVAAEYQDKAELTSGAFVGGINAGVKSGVKVQPSAGVVWTIATNAAEDKWAAVGISKSGRAMVRTNASTEVFVSTAKFTGSTTIAVPGLPTGITVGGTAAAPTVTIAP